jgi:Primosomal protein N'' (replication factor Y) - superfamily II helicase
MANTYRCPSCGAPLEYTPGTNGLVCTYCGTEVSIEQLSRNETGENSEDRTENHTASDIEDTHARQSFNGYTCESCGAQLITDEYTTATTCCYCGSSALIQERLNGVLKPTGVIPFKINKEQAKQSFRRWLCKGMFTPSVFKQKATLEHIKGIYVPFWLYDYHAEISASAECTKIYRQRRGNTEFVHTDYYIVERQGFSNYQKIPVDASEKMPDDMMDLMEPYNYNELKEFEMPYLSGYESEKYNYESSDTQMTGRVEERVNNYILQDMRNSITGYSSTHILRKQISLHRNRADYTLLPVWMITYRYKGENKSFVINGQTGKQVGELPNSPVKIAAWFGGITAGIMALLLLMGGFFG